MTMNPKITLRGELDSGYLDSAGNAGPVADASEIAFDGAGLPADLVNITRVQAALAALAARSTTGQTASQVQSAIAAAIAAIPPVMLMNLVNGTATDGEYIVYDASANGGAGAFVFRALPASTGGTITGVQVAAPLTGGGSSGNVNLGIPAGTATQDGYYPKEDAAKLAAFQQASQYLTRNEYDVHENDGFASLASASTFGSLAGTNGHRGRFAFSSSATGVFSSATQYPINQELADGTYTIGIANQLYSQPGQGFNDSLAVADYPVGLKIYLRASNHSPAVNYYELTVLGTAANPAVSTATQVGSTSTGYIWARVSLVKHGSPGNPSWWLISEHLRHTIPLDALANFRGYRGAWVSGTTYMPGDMVLYEVSAGRYRVYVATDAGAQGTITPAQSTSWDELGNDVSVHSIIGTAPIQALSTADNEITISFTAPYNRGVWSAAPAYAEGDIAKDPGNGRWYICILSQRAGQDTPRSNSVGWRQIDGGGGTSGGGASTYKGDWVSGTAYAIGDIVRDTVNTNFYICRVVRSTSETTPPRNDEPNWDLLVTLESLKGHTTSDRFVYPRASVLNLISGLSVGNGVKGFMQVASNATGVPSVSQIYQTFADIQPGERTLMFSQTSLNEQHGFTGFSSTEAGEVRFLTQHSPLDKDNAYVISRVGTVRSHGSGNNAIWYADCTITQRGTPTASGDSQDILVYSQEPSALPVNLPIGSIEGLSGQLAELGFRIDKLDSEVTDLEAAKVEVNPRLPGGVPINEADILKVGTAYWSVLQTSDFRYKTAQYTWDVGGWFNTGFTTDLRDLLGLFSVNNPSLANQQYDDTAAVNVLFRLTDNATGAIGLGTKPDNASSGASNTETLTAGDIPSGSHIIIQPRNRRTSNTATIIVVRTTGEPVLQEAGTQREWLRINGAINVLPKGGAFLTATDPNLIVTIVKPGELNQTSPWGTGMLNDESVIQDKFLADTIGAAELDADTDAKKSAIRSEIKAALATSEVDTLSSRADLVHERARFAVLTNETSGGTRADVTGVPFATFTTRGGRTGRRWQRGDSGTPSALANSHITEIRWQPLAGSSTEWTLEVITDSITTPWDLVEVSIGGTGLTTGVFRLFRDAENLEQKAWSANTVMAFTTDSDYSALRAFNVNVKINTNGTSSDTDDDWLFNTPASGNTVKLVDLDQIASYVLTPDRVLGALIAAVGKNVLEDEYKVYEDTLPTSPKPDTGDLAGLLSHTGNIRRNWSTGSSPNASTDFDSRTLAGAGLPGNQGWHRVTFPSSGDGTPADNSVYGRIEAFRYDQVNMASLAWCSLAAVLGRHSASITDEGGWANYAVFLKIQVGGSGFHTFESSHYSFYDRTGAAADFSTGVYHSLAASRIARVTDIVFRDQDGRVRHFYGGGNGGYIEEYTEPEFTKPSDVTVTANLFNGQSWEALATAPKHTLVATWNLAGKYMNNNTGTDIRTGPLTISTEGMARGYTVNRDGPGTPGRNFNLITPRTQTNMRFYFHMFVLKWGDDVMGVIHAPVNFGYNIINNVRAINVFGFMRFRPNSETSTRTINLQYWKDFNSGADGVFIHPFSVNSQTTTPFPDDSKLEVYEVEL